MPLKKVLDCLQELDHIEQSWQGSVDSVADILLTIQDPMERMCCAMLSCAKLREHNQTENLNFQPSETVWRVAMALHYQDMSQTIAQCQSICDAMLDMVQEGEYKPKKRCLISVITPTQSHKQDVCQLDWIGPIPTYERGKDIVE